MLTILSLLLRLVAAIGLSLILPFLVALFYGEWLMAGLLLLISASSISILLSLKLHLPPLTEISPIEAMSTASLGWLLAALIASLPYMFSGYMSPLDAYFESMSGLTTTGMTLFENIETLPKSLLFWRALTQWLGGVGVVLFFLLIVAPGGLGVWKLYLAEAREVRLTVRAWDTVKIIWLIYVGYTVICMAVLILMGMEVYEAVCHSFTALSTGGFSTRTANVGGLANPAVEAVLVVFMIVGGTSFFVHSLMLRGDFKRALLNTELRFMLIIIFTSGLIITLDVHTHGLDLASSLRLAFFQATSIATTTGYTTVDVNILPPLSKTMLMALMVMGGSLCSTAGAVKVARLLILAKVAQNETSRALLPPTAIKPVKVDDRVLELDDILRVTGFFFIYMILAMVATFILVAEGHDLASAISAALSAQGNVGPAYLTPSLLSPVGKTVLIFCMWAGRLELMPILALLMPKTWRELLRPK